MVQAIEDQWAMAEETAGRVATRLGEFSDTLSTEEQIVLDVSLSPLVSEGEGADVNGYAAKRVIVWAVSHAILWYFDHATPIWEIYEPSGTPSMDPPASNTGGCCTRYQ